MLMMAIGNILANSLKRVFFRRRLPPHPHLAWKPIRGRPVHIQSEDIHGVLHSFQYSTGELRAFPGRRVHGWEMGEFAIVPNDNPNYHRFKGVLPGMKEQKWIHEGLIIESLPNGMFQVRLDNEDMILSYLSGKIRCSFIRILSKLK